MGWCRSSKIQTVHSAHVQGGHQLEYKVGTIWNTYQRLSGACLCLPEEVEVHGGSEAIQTGRGASEILQRFVGG